MKITRKKSPDVEGFAIYANGKLTPYRIVRGEKHGRRQEYDLCRMEHGYNAFVCSFRSPGMAGLAFSNIAADLAEIEKQP